MLQIDFKLFSEEMGDPICSVILKQIHIYCWLCSLTWPRISVISPVMPNFYTLSRKGTFSKKLLNIK